MQKTTRIVALAAISAFMLVSVGCTKSLTKPKQDADSAKSTTGDTTTKPPPPPPTP
ncbi:hypothetical protein [Pinibacter soli]|uniref:Uncharacterized protein n=1 Tax=Pinibacter soli TaxID=3044211 RepID=A0ABT6R9C5_9BACT|nr:hypothetical protein [Pinibacter soli]MDI3319166.1 hypothetical protein [Pinibacter soli]